MFVRPVRALQCSSYRQIRTRGANSGGVKSGTDFLIVYACGGGDATLANT